MRSAAAGEPPADETEVDMFFAEEEMETISVASKHAQPVAASPASVVVITRREIEESGATTIPELLRLYPPIRVYMYEPLYQAAEARGTIRILLTIDGRAVNLELFIAPFYAVLPVGIRDVERIEIVMGPNSALYGPNAVAAVINIVTRKPDKDFHTDLFLAAGERGATVLEALFTGGAGPLALRGSLGTDRAYSLMQPELLTKGLLHADLAVQADLPAGTLALNGGLVEGSGRFYGIMGYMEFQKFLMAHGLVDYELGDLKVRAYWYGIRTRFDLDLDLVHPSTGLDLGETPTFDLNADTLQAESQYNLRPWQGNLLIVGGDFRYNLYGSEQLVDPELTEIRFGVFVHDEQKLGERLQLALGARFDWNSVTDWAVSPRLGLVYRPWGQHYLRLSAGMAHRKPLLIETSANFQVKSDFPEIETLFEVVGISNPDLKNEILSSIELGYRGQYLSGDLRLDTHVYLGINRHWIGFATEVKMNEFNQIDLEGSNFGYGNFGDDTNIVGWCLHVESDPLDFLSLYLRGELRYEWVQATGKEKDETANIMAVAGAFLRLPFGLTAHLAWIFSGERYEDLRDPRSILAPVSWSITPAVSCLMGSLLYRLNLDRTRLDLGLMVFNPFGARFREVPGIITPQGGNYGAEPLGMRTMLTARLHY